MHKRTNIPTKEARRIMYQYDLLNRKFEFRDGHIERVTLDMLDSGYEDNILNALYKLNTLSYFNLIVNYIDKLFLFLSHHNDNIIYIALELIHKLLNQYIDTLNNNNKLINRLMVLITNHKNVEIIKSSKKILGKMCETNSDYRTILLDQNVLNLIEPSDTFLIKQLCKNYQDPRLPDKIIPNCIIDSDMIKALSYLSLGKNDVIQKMIDYNIIDTLNANMNENLIEDIIELYGNISAGSDEHVEKLITKGHVFYLIHKCITSQHLKKSVAFLLSNILGTKINNEYITTELLVNVSYLLRDSDPELMNEGMWVLHNYIYQYGVDDKIKYLINKNLIDHDLQILNLKST